LTGTAQSISEQRDFSVRAKKLGDDELGLLTDAFNEMLGEIDKLNATLEQRVAARTAELGFTNLELERQMAERLSAEEALATALEKERLLLNSAVDVICTIDADGRFVTINPACEQLWGYSQEELIGRKHIELVVPDDVDKTNEAAADIMAGNKATDFENCYRHKNGSLVHVMWSASWSESEQVFFSVARDITLRHLNEAATSTLASIVESSADAIISKTLAGTITSWNAGAQRLFGYAAEEIIGQHVSKLFPPERSDEETHIRETIARNERIENFETVRIRKDGKQIQVSVTVSAVKDKKGNVVGISKIARDITEQKIAGEKLKKFATELQRSNSELQDFASVASHDLQEPLRKIQSFADELKRSVVNKIDADEQDMLDRIVSAGGRMRTLINDLLAFSRVTTMARPFVPVDLALIAKEVMSDLEVRLVDTKGRIEVHDLPTIDADPLQMRQLLQNLIGNGLKFHAPGVTPLITVTCENGGPNYRLSVTDNGIGFDEKYVDRIFTVFQRLHGRREYEGTGIGLAICRKIAERHGGQIEAHSVPGAGSTFTVTLPGKQTNEEKL
jgi:two-component system sensor kinase FixL